MKQFFVFVVFFALTRTAYCQIPTNYSDWEFEHKVTFKQKATNVINTVFYKIQTKEGWKYDKFNGGSIDMNYDFNSIVGGEVSFNISGTWSFTRDSWFDSGQRKGTFTGTARVTKSGTVYIQEICWKTGLEAGRCHTTTDWAYESMFN